MPYVKLLANFLLLLAVLFFACTLAHALAHATLHIYAAAIAHVLYSVHHSLLALRLVKCECNIESRTYYYYTVYARLSK